MYGNIWEIGMGHSYTIIRLIALQKAVASLHHEMLNMHGLSVARRYILICVCMCVCGCVHVYIDVWTLEWMRVTFNTKPGFPVDSCTDLKFYNRFWIKKKKKTAKQNLWWFSFYFSVKVLNALVATMKDVWIQPKLSAYLCVDDEYNLIK